MESAGTRPSLHRLIAEAVERGERLQDESRAALDAIYASTTELQRTLDAIHRAREERRDVRKRT